MTTQAYQPGQGESPPKPPKPEKAAKQTKPMSLINSTQSKLLEKRLKEVCDGKCLIYVPDDDDNSPMEAKWLAEQFRAGKLKLKTEPELSQTVERLLLKGGEAKRDGTMTISSYDWDLEPADIFEPHSVLDVVTEWNRIEEDMLISAKSLAIKVNAKKKVIERALADGEHTGAEIVAMIDDIENLKVGE